MLLRKLILFVCLLMIVAISACRKKEEDKPQKIDDVIYPSYSHLDSGNYWIYQQFLIDSAGNATATTDYDSCYVAKDTVIGNVTWHRYVQGSLAGGGQGEMLLRDSLQYVVDISGAIHFAALDFSTVLYHKLFLDPAHNLSLVDTLAVMERKMVDQHKSVTVPAGTFVTSTARLTWTINDTMVQMGFRSPRIQDTRYAMEVGIITETLPFYLFDPGYAERRLVRYHLH